MCRQRRSAERRDDARVRHEGDVELHLLQAGGHAHIQHPPRLRWVEPQRLPWVPVDDPRARGQHRKDEGAADDCGAAESRARSQHVEPRKWPPAVDQGIGDHNVRRIDQDPYNHRRARISRPLKRRASGIRERPERHAHGRGLQVHRTLVARFILRAQQVEPSAAQEPHHHSHEHAPYQCHQDRVAKRSGRQLRPVRPHVPRDHGG